MTAVFCHKRPTARPRPGASNWRRSPAWSSPSPTPPRGSPRRSGNSRGPPRRPGSGPGARPWTSSTRRKRPTGSWPGTGVQSEAAVGEGREAADAAKLSARTGKDSMRGARPTPPVPPGQERSRRSSRSSGSKRPGAGAAPRWTCSAPTAGSTTAPGPRPRSPRACRDLTGPEWSKVRNFLTDRRSLTFLDRMHRRLEAAEPRREWREAMAWRWWLRHRGSPNPGLSPLAAWFRPWLATTTQTDRAEAPTTGSRRCWRHGAGQQRRGVHEQRVADAAVAAPPDDPADARPEAAVLELPPVPLRPPQKDLPVPGPGPGVAHVRLLGVAPLRSGDLTQELSTSRKPA